MNRFYNKFLFFFRKNQESGFYASEKNIEYNKNMFKLLTSELLEYKRKTYDIIAYGEEDNINQLIDCIIYMLLSNRVSIKQISNISITDLTTCVRTFSAYFDNLLLNITH